MTSRRQWLLSCARAIPAALAVALGWRAWRARPVAPRTVWQIDPRRCTQCGRCATACVLTPSAVKCVHAYAMCGYCKLCFGYFQPNAPATTEAAENQLCPTGAIQRTFIEDPYFEYSIDEPRCIGCGLCVKGCSRFGNGSLFLQIRHDRCVQCNDCDIARNCPAQAIRRVPASTPYLLKDALPPLESAATRTRAARTGAAVVAGLLLTGLATAARAAEVARFPQPQFESGHPVPVATHPALAAWLTPTLDVAVLLGAMLLAAWLLLVRRSRRATLWLAAAAVLWFGFVRRGCICPVGGVQNLAAACGGVAGGGFTWAVAAFVVLPLLVALLFGRLFCAAICPLGALQELGTVRPLRLPAALQAALRFVPVLVLAAALLLAGNDAGFLVCKTDPYVAFFRRAGSLPRLLIGVGMLLLGTVVARPYCRFLCPYGVLLGWCSLLAWRHVRITPDDCVQCRLCERVCPVEAIRPPRAAAPPRPNDWLRALGWLLLIPLLVAALAWGGRTLSPRLAVHQRDVALYDRLQIAPQAGAEAPDDVAAFRAAGGDAAALAAEAARVVRRFARGGGWVGGGVGLVLALRLLAFARRARRDDYTIDREACVSCGRCMVVCPRELARRRARTGVAT